ncbi:MAG: tetratricopeptide repeat protein [Planctomycetaceae bacterium]|jgi:tetratricopeptide (TPR) repeat protein|nr:tetratricopeptide repeat protein [Planctomycetaceae bacterium]
MIGINSIENVLKLYPNKEKMKLTTTIFLAAFSLSIFVSGLNFAQQVNDNDNEPKPADTNKNGAEITEDNPGLPLLDQAIEEKLKATNEQDLNDVIALAQRAKKEGLQATNLKFCNEFIASVQAQRGSWLASRIISKPVEQLPESWKIIRTRALNDLEAAAQIIKTLPKVFIQIAQLNLMPGGNIEKAKNALNEAESICKNQPDLFVQVIVMKTMLENDPVKREELLAKATKEIEDQRLIFFHIVCLIDLKKFDESLSLLKKVLEKEPDNPQALQLSLEVYRNLKQFTEALATLEKLEKILSFDAAILMRAKIYIDMGKRKEAMDIIDKLRVKLPNNIEILLLHATLAQDMKLFDKAIKDIDSAIDLVGNDNEQQLITLKIFKVRLLTTADKFNEAMQILDELDKRMPDDLGVKMLRINAFHDQKKYKEALEMVEPLLKDHQNNLALLRLKGNILMLMHRHSDAIKIFEEVIKADPTDETTLNNLSWILSTSPIDMVRNGKRALELAIRACELSDYKAAYILSTLAAAYAEIGDFKKAIEFSQKSIDLSANDPNVNERINALKEELETYKKNMPYRELSDDNKK